MRNGSFLNAELQREDKVAPGPKASHHEDVWGKSASILNIGTALK